MPKEIRVNVRVTKDQVEKIDKDIEELREYGCEIKNRSDYFRKIAGL